MYRRYSGEIRNPLWVETGIKRFFHKSWLRKHWIPAFAGMTVTGQ